MRRVLLLSLAFTFAACQTVIQEGVSEDEANAIVVALDEQGIAADKVRSEGNVDNNGYRIAVANDDVTHALTVLRAAELPHRADPGVASVFAEPGLVPTATEERARYATALGGDIARSIESMDGVLDARVHIALPDNHDVALDDVARRPRASVMIKHRGAHAPYSVEAVRSLVAGAVQGLRSEDIAVVGVPVAPRAATRASFVHIGPVAVSRGSATSLKAILGSALLLDVLLAAALIAVLLRRRNSASGEPSASV